MGRKNKYGEFLGLNVQVSGEVYEIIIDNNDILYIRDSTDNNLCDLHTKPYVDTESSAVDKIYVENQNLTIYDFTNEKEQLINKGSGYIRKRFGHEHTTIDGSPYLPVYFTVDGYVVKANRPVMYCKCSKEDYLSMNFFERDVDFKLMFIDGEINPELLKELEGK